MEINEQQFVVYAHSCGNEIFYVGSGNLSRAYATSNRGCAWVAARRDRPFTVSILSTHADRKAAYLEEYRHIAGLQPKGNLNGRGYGVTARAHASGLKVGRPRTRWQEIARTNGVVCIVAHPSGRRFGSLWGAARAFGISTGTVSLSINKKRRVKSKKVWFTVEPTPDGKRVYDDLWRG